MERFLRRFTILAVSVLAAAIVVVAGVAFLCGALYLALLSVTTPPLAALATGLVAFAVALLILIAGDLIAGRRHSASERRGGVRGGRPPLAIELGYLASDEIGKLARKRPAAALLASLLAGFAIGFSPQLRKALRDLLEH